MRASHRGVSWQSTIDRIYRSEGVLEEVRAKGGSRSATPLVQANRTRDLEGARITLREGLFALLALITSLCWAQITRWYSLLANRSNTHFAFEKLPGWFDSPVLRSTLWLFLALALIYGVGYWLLQGSRADSPAIRIGILLFVIGPGIANILLYPVGALDVFNYMIELKLTYHYDQNPYLVTFAGYRDDPFALPAFLVDVPLFYGPVWLLVSGIPAAVVGFEDFVHLLLALKIFNLLLLAVTALAIYTYQEASKQGWLAAYLFLANPLILFEGVGNAHNDVLMTLFMIAALLALKRRSWTAGALLTLSVLVKFITVILAPLFLLVMLTGKRIKRRLVATALLSLAVVVAALAPYWAGGAMIDGLSQGIVASQRMDHASVVSLAQQYAAQIRVANDPQPWRSALVRPDPNDRILSDEEKRPLQRLCAGLFVLCALLLAVAFKRGWGVERVVVYTLMLGALLLTNLYPWYLIPIFAALTLKPDRLRLGYLFAATALGLVYYPMYVYAHFNTDWPIFRVHLFLALFLTLPMVTLLAYEVCRSGFRMVAAHRGGREHQPAA